MDAPRCWSALRGCPVSLSWPLEKAALSSPTAQQIVDETQAKIGRDKAPYLALFASDAPVVGLDLETLIFPTLVIGPTSITTNATPGGRDLDRLLKPSSHIDDEDHDDDRRTTTPPWRHMI